MHFISARIQVQLIAVKPLPENCFNYMNISGVFEVLQTAAK